MNSVLLMLAAHLAVMSSQFGSNIQVTDNVWNSYKLEHEKQYSSVAEDALRRQVFAYTKHRVEQFNRENPDASFKLGLNRLSDLSQREFDSKNGFKPSQDFVEIVNDNNYEHIVDIDAPVPDEVDWRKVAGVVSSVKDQLSCSSDWAFTAVGILEGQENARTVANVSSNEITSLSVQELVDCDTVDENCYGGQVEYALMYIHNNGGIESDKDYPYKSAYQGCQRDDSKPKFMAHKSSKFLPSGDEEVMKKYVAQYGPIGAVIHTSPLFQAYDSGILDDNVCVHFPYFVRHYVLIVGYGTDSGKDFWIVKNTWGDDWGEDGFVRMSRNKKNQCGIANSPIIATF